MRNQRPVISNEMMRRLLIIANQDRGLISNVERLLQREGVSINSVDESGRTPLLRAVVECDESAIISLLQSSEINLNAEDKEGKTALMLALEKGYVEIVKILLDRGLTFSLDQVQDISRVGHTALVYALFRLFPKETAVAFLREKRIDIDTRDAGGRTALMIAATRKKGRSLVAALLQARADPNLVANGSTALLLAIKEENIGTIEALINYGARLLIEQAAAIYNKPYLLCNMALVYAIYRSFQVDAMRAAREQELDIDIAMLQANAEVLFFLRQIGMPDINAATTGFAHEPLLVRAAQGDRIHVVRLFLEVGANPNTPTGDRLNQGPTPLIYAASNGNQAMVELLLGAGADVNFTPRGERPALIVAVTNGHTGIVELLLRAGANVNSSSALIYAASNGNQAIVELLLGAGADVNFTPPGERAALIVAVENGYTGIVELLLRSGANVNFSSALLIALANGHMKIADHLITHGAAVTRDRPDFFVLETFRHSLNTNTAIASLQEDEININATGAEGRTALILAALASQAQIVRALLEAGAEVNLRDQSGSTALSYAMARGNLEIIDLLLAKEADFTVNIVPAFIMLVKRPEDFIIAMDRMLVYAAQRAELGFLSCLITVGRAFIEDNEESFASEATLIAVAASAMPDNAETIKLLKQCLLYSVEKQLKIAKLRELKRSLELQLEKRNDSDPELSARIIIVALASDPKMMRLAMGIKDVHSALSGRAENIKERIAQYFVISSSPLNPIQQLNPAQQQALKIVLRKMLWNRLHKEEEKVRSSINEEAGVEESKDESGAEEYKDKGGAIEEKAEGKREMIEGSEIVAVTEPETEMLESKNPEEKSRNRNEEETVEPESPQLRTQPFTSPTGQTATRLQTAAQLQRLHDLRK